MDWIIFIITAAIVVISGVIANNNVKCPKCNKKLVSKKYLWTGPSNGAVYKVCVDCFNAPTDDLNSEEQSGN